jgi:Spy/CpxP family protein refolding chaperone
MQMKRWVAPLVMALAVALAGSAYAADQQKGKKGNGKHFDRMVKELQLTPDQQVKIQEHKQNQQKQIREINAQLRANQEQINAELAKPDLDKARVEQLTQERKTLEAARVDQRIAARLEMRAILSPEQYQKLESSRDKKQQKMKSGKGMHMGKDKACSDMGACAPCE